MFSLILELATSDDILFTLYPVYLTLVFFYLCLLCYSQVVPE